MDKHTKIIATISDKRCEVDFIRSLYEQGMNVVRLNSAHISTESASTILNNVRSVSNDIPLIIDTKGPEIRLTKTDEEKIMVKKGEIIKIAGSKDKISTKECLYANYDYFVRDLQIGNRILIDDGELEMIVVNKNEEFLFCEMQDAGQIKSRKSINVPGVRIKLPALSERDLEFVMWAIKNDVDFIAHSFIRTRDDVLAIQNILDTYNSKVKIIAKIENQNGVDNIEEILDLAYGVMIARGDLGVDLPLEKIPIIQKELINKCLKRKKTVIVATQMLHTMIENPRPTRAEVSDIANAVLNGTDAIMLSGETANGKYPVEAVKVMTRICKEIESSMVFDYNKSVSTVDKQIPAFLAKSAVNATEQLGVAAIITDTFTGRTVRFLAAFRGRKPVFAICYDDRVRRELAMSYGVFPFKIPIWKTTDEFKTNSLNLLVELKCIEINDLVLIIGGNFNPNTGVSFIDISNAKTLINQSRE